MTKLLNYDYWEGSECDNLISTLIDMINRVMLGQHFIVESRKDAPVTQEL